MINGMNAESPMNDEEEGIATVSPRPISACAEGSHRRGGDRGTTPHSPARICGDGVPRPHPLCRASSA